MKWAILILATFVIAISGCVNDTTTTTTVPITNTTTSTTILLFPQTKPTTTTELMASTTITTNCINEEGLEIQPGECDTNNLIPYYPIPYCDPKTGKFIENCTVCGCTGGYSYCGEDGKCFLYLCGNRTYDPNVHDCVNDEFILKSHTKNFGILYVYWNNDTYNSLWREKISPIIEKTKSTLLTLTEGKADYSFDILGEIKTQEFCWNPSRLAWASQQKQWKIDTSTGEIVDYWELEYTDETDEYHRGDPTNLNIIPGSDFGTYSYSLISYEQRIFEDGKEYLLRFESEIYYNDCNNCKIYEEDKTQEYQDQYPEKNYTYFSETYLEFDCGENNLIKQKHNSTKTYELKRRASEELGFSLDDYDGIILIFGKLGPLLPDESDINHYRRCHSITAFWGGYANLVMAENALYQTGFLDCSEYDSTSANYYGFYMQEGWTLIPHELLHHLGAVDVYSTGTVFGVTTYLDEAKELDPRYMESIMGDRLKPCMADLDTPMGGQGSRNNLCSQEELAEAYLDRLNRQKIGLE